MKTEHVQRVFFSMPRVELRSESSEPYTVKASPQRGFHMIRILTNYEFSGVFLNLYVDGKLLLTRVPSEYFVSHAWPVRFDVDVRQGAKVILQVFDERRGRRRPLYWSNLAGQWFKTLCVVLVGVPKR